MTDESRVRAWPLPRFDFEREAIIDEACREAFLEAQEDGDPVLVKVCAGKPWCDGTSGVCDWCTRVVVTADGRRARSEPGHA